MSDYSELYNAILTGNAKKAEEVTKTAIAAKADPRRVVSGRSKAKDGSGRTWEPTDAHPGSRADKTAPGKIRRNSWDRKL